MSFHNFVLQIVIWCGLLSSPGQQFVNNLTKLIANLGCLKHYNISSNDFGTFYPLPSLIDFRKQKYTTT